jgi:hypothetical protein
MKRENGNFVRPLILAFATAILAVVPCAAQQPAQQGAAPSQGAQTASNPMKAPYPPFQIIGSIYYVGSAGLACYLIKTSEGEILLDSGYPDMAAQN